MPQPPQAMPQQQPGDVRSVYEAALRESEATTRTVPNGGATGHDGATNGATDGASDRPAPGSFEALLAETVGMPRQPGVSLQVADIFFAHGSAQIDGRDREVLREVVAMHKERGGRIRVIGHASSRTGSMDLAEHKLANFNISVSRADAVAAELVRLGADRSAVLTSAQADHERVYFESMPNGEAGNRRAEIYLDY